MYAVSASLFVLLVATLTLIIMCGTQMAVEGLPLARQERAAEEYEDILAGNDFLSVLMESTLHRFQKETTVTSEELQDLLDETTTEPYLRQTREANYFVDEVPQTTERQFYNINTSDSSSDGVIIAVHVSSSVGSQINKNSRVSETTAQPVLDQNFLSSEEHLSIVANNAKSELNVEEPAPVTKDNSNSNDNSNNNRLQASIQNLPQSQHIAFNPNGFIKDNVPPFHHSLIYHDTPTQPGRARSVSYSTIIQDIQPANEKTSETLERKERNYETGNVYRNSFDDGSKSEYSQSSSKSFDVGSKNDYSLPSTTTTEKPWPKPYPPAVPKIYGRSEQNYEVEEAVSVETNGRTHGIQGATQKPKTDQDKDQKVGYVVEGRNYRKYRVEERTPDGFIVGEYGVVSHDDGSLRGVRYTADGTINPRLIYDALMKFLAL